ncbi:MAG TPA: OmpA family protein [Bryobacteraceae bacterium]|nr:OmpA family protein [Bryobacteraceae bacterium]
MKIASAFLTVCGLAWAQAPQAPNPTQHLNQQVIDNGGGRPIFRITVVGRTTKAINYNHRSGSTRIGFRGTELMPDAHGEAKVESKQGVIKIDAEMENLGPATQFGPEYLTYVMWAVTPEGRATNVGEVLINHSGKTKLDATTELQSFGLIVTAEPYFAVTQPSDAVVMENFVRTDTVGTIEEVDAKYELLQRGQYVLNVKPGEIRSRDLNPKVPLELYEARNAVQIARWTGAEQYAADTFQKAVDGLENAEGYLIGRAGKKPIGTVARESVQMAEDARIITVKKIEEEQLADERRLGAERQARVEGDRDAAQSETDRVKREAALARVTALANAERLKFENESQTAAAQVEADRLRRENEARLAASETEANRLKQENEAQRLAAQDNLDRAARDRAQAEAERTQLRAQLLDQFNAILQTRDTVRGLIVNVSDVLFDTAKYSLRPLAREKLAKVAGIVSGHPGLRLDVEGHTDNVGGDDYNQKLSEQRGDSVRDYLTKEGMQPNSVSSRGFGKTQPIASNDTAAGRQENRRVELVISGEIIGTQIGQPVAVR